MKNLILFGFLLFSLSTCIAQETVTARYVGYQYKSTKNNSFMCKEMRFVPTNNNDTLYINIRLPLKVNINDFNDTTGVEIVNMGIYHNCHLKEDNIYTIVLKKICINEIPEVCNSYYKINAIFDKDNRSQFTEFEKHTPYEYGCGYSKGYGKFVDIKGILYEIVGLKPDNDCFYP